MDFEFLFQPVEAIDHWLSGMLDSAPLLVALGIAFVLGLRHASDPDHLVAVTSLVAADGRDTRRAAALGAWWGLGHGGTLLVVGLPLILLKSELPAWLELGAERAVGVVILLLAGRVVWKWLRGDYRVGPHFEQPHRHVYRAFDHGHHHIRSPRHAFGIGLLHGLAGTGAVVLLLVAALPSQLEAAGALLLFAPMSVLSMAACTSVFAWALTRPVLEPVYRSVLIPGFGAFGMLFGTWYVGLV
jgi:ABC-type nickel/cobalt efflux system permease component RcnA